MKSYLGGFNPYLALALVFVASGCVSNDAQVDYKKEVTTLRFYLEGNRGDTAGTGTVLVTHEKFRFTVERDPFLTEADLTKATLIDDPGPGGSYVIQLNFSEHGGLFLDMMTTRYKSRHIIIFSQFPVAGTKPPKDVKIKQRTDDDEANPVVTPPAAEAEVPGKPRQSAWLAAVLIHDRNPSGIFRFTPDATHEEGERIVRGLKNIIKINKKNDKVF